ncbi:hypothetical protein LINPERPRIM_LOCUS7645, partial [Linum perenne]
SFSPEKTLAAITLKDRSSTRSSSKLWRGRSGSQLAWTK